MLEIVKKHWLKGYIVLLMAFTAFVLLKTFVLPSAKISNLESAGIYAATTEESSADGTSQAEGVSTDNYYSDGNITIQLNIERIKDTTVYIADITVSNVKYLKTALAGNAFGRNINETTLVMAQEQNAILAINGDYYGFRDAGYVLRNGVLYRNNYSFAEDEMFAVFEDGSCKSYAAGAMTAETLQEEGAVQILSFGPALVEAGEIDTAGIAANHQTLADEKNPRTAVGMIEPLHYVFMVCDGRTTEDAGMSLYDVAEVMKEYGCTEAYNLDGGGSSTLYFNGMVVNKPTDGQKSGEREVSDIVYIGY